MMWDFRNLVHRSGGKWPRDWRESSRKPIRPPSDKKDDAWGRKPEDPGKKPDEHWLSPGWQPPPGSADAWKKSED